MCIPCRQRDPRTRRQMFLANISLVVALVMWTFIRPSTGPGHAWLDGLCGLLFGISIGINLLVLRRGRRYAP